MRALIAPDKFTGSLTADEVARAIGSGMNGVDVAYLPLADGGDGSVDAAIAAGCAPVVLNGGATIAVRNDTVLVELANTCGIQTLPAGTREPMLSSTRGLGEAILEALTLAPRSIVIALGGSASTDGGAGMLAALGVQFLDRDGAVVEPNGGSLERIHSADTSGLPDLGGVELVCATDVINPLLGADGAAAVFGPQKGATGEQIARLEAGLATLARVLGRADEPGAGAAGGAAYGCLLLGARLVSGADYFLDLLGFDALAAASDLVITGEGSLDSQTASGKLVAVVAARSAAPVVAVVGRCLLSPDEAHALALAGVYSTSEWAGRDTSDDREATMAALTSIGTAIGAHLGR
ncbi:glycerate kinase [soil metagenome]